jgi:hypothetical protein
VPPICEFYPGICLTTEKKARKNLIQAKKNLSQVKKNLSQCTVYILPKTPTHYKALTNTHITKPTHTNTHAHTHTTKQYKTTTVQIKIKCTLTLSNPIFLPTVYSPALICFGLERGWWITCNYPTVLKEKTWRYRKSTTWAICG